MNKNELSMNGDICDTIANIIIQKQEEVKTNLDAQIWVTWVDRFFVVNGFTTLTNVFDTSSVVNDALSSMYGEDWTPINIVDLIRYGEKVNTERIHCHYHFTKDDISLTSEPYPIKSLSTFTKPVISQDIFGKSVSHKNYYFLSAKIANHIYYANYTSDGVSISINKDTQEVHIILDGKHTVNPDFINNVVDACFSGKFQQEFDRMNLKDFNFLDYINQKMNYPWHERNHMKDFMMI